MASINVDILLDIGVVHEGEYACGIHAFIFFRARLLLALSVQVGDVRASVSKHSFDVVRDVEAVGAVPEYSASLVVGVVFLLGNVVVVLQELHGIGSELEVGVAFIAQCARILNQKSF